VFDRLRSVVVVGLVDPNSAANSAGKQFMRTVNGPLQTVKPALFDGV
jgi:hypothetical protein